MNEKKPTPKEIAAAQAVVGKTNGDPGMPPKKIEEIDLLRIRAAEYHVRELEREIEAAQQRIRAANIQGRRANAELVAVRDQLNKTYAIIIGETHGIDLDTGEIFDLRKQG